jgi:hypothetical protein
MGIKEILMSILMNQYFTIKSNSLELMDHLLICFTIL